MSVRVSRPISVEQLSNPAEARRVLHVGWALVAVLPAVLVAAIFVGSWLLAVQGYSDGAPDLPVSAMLTAGVPALLVLVAPLIAAAWCGRRAERLGDRGGRVLFFIAVTAVAVTVALNLMQILTTWVAGT